MMTKLIIKRMTVIGSLIFFMLTSFQVRAEEAGQENHWFISMMGGYIYFENDEAVRDAALSTLGVGYDLSPRWTLESVVEYCPKLKTSYHQNGAGNSVSHLSEEVGHNLTETASIRFALDSLLHIAPKNRIDPYLAAGLGCAAYQDDVNDRCEPLLRVGGGLFANLTKRWALRFDSRVIFAGSNPDINLITSVGLVCRFGAKPIHPKTVFVAPPIAKNVNVFDLNLNFDPGKWDIKPEYLSELNVIGRLLEKQLDSKAHIEGYELADTKTDEKTAQVLSEKRAGAVRDYLQSKWNIRAARMISVGLGTSQSKSDSGQTTQRIKVFITAP